MTRTVHAAAGALVLAAALAAATATARVPAGPPGTPLVLAQSGDVGPAAAAAAARGATGGRVLDVRASRSGGGVVYLVKVLLPEGRVRTVIVDGASGQVR